MSIQVSRKCDYALKAMIKIAGLKEGDLYTAKSISKSERIPLKFLEKILQALVGHSLLRVTYGPRGGYRLAKAAESITFRHVMEAVEGPLRLNLCVGDHPECKGEECAVKPQWAKLQEEVIKIFENTTLADSVRPLVKARGG